MIEYTVESFPNSGIFNLKFKEEHLQPLKQEIYEIKNNFNNSELASSKLAGHLKHEYSLTKSKKYVENLLLPCINEYNKHFRYIDSVNILNKDVPITLDKLWVNFQKKYEFNPVHDHSGLMSFVIWIEIPYNIKDEFDLFPNVNNNQTACFNFLYSDIFGRTVHKAVPADKTFENCGLLFPSVMMHYVNPFYTSENYRISVSGNFKLTI